MIQLKQFVIISFFTSWKKKFLFEAFSIPIHRLLGLIRFLANWRRIEKEKVFARNIRKFDDIVGIVIQYRSGRRDRPILYNWTLLTFVSAGEINPRRILFVLVGVSPARMTRIKRITGDRQNKIRGRGARIIPPRPSWSPRFAHSSPFRLFFLSGARGHGGGRPGWARPNDDSRPISRPFFLATIKSSSVLLDHFDTRLIRKSFGNHRRRTSSIGGLCEEADEKTKKRRKRRRRRSTSTTTKARMVRRRMTVVAIASTKDRRRVGEELGSNGCQQCGRGGVKRGT